MNRRIARWTWLVCVACASYASAGGADPVQWQLAVSRTNAAAAHGSRVTARVTATIASEWHVYALDQEKTGPTPTSITVPDGQPFVLDGEIQQPQPIMAWDQNFNHPARYFTDKVTFTVPLRATAQRRAGSETVKVRVAYQICSDRLCLPPKAVDLSARVNR